MKILVEGSRGLLLFEVDIVADAVRGFIYESDYERSRCRRAEAGHLVKKPAEWCIGKLDDNPFRDNHYDRFDAFLGFCVACAGTDRHREDERDECADGALLTTLFRHLIRFREEAPHEAFPCFHDVLL